MEYEIDDDPQGECDVTEADRTGGVKEDRILRRTQKDALCRPARDLQPS